MIIGINKKMEILLFNTLTEPKELQSENRDFTSTYQLKDKNENLIDGPRTQV